MVRPRFSSAIGADRECGFNGSRVEQQATVSVQVGNTPGQRFCPKPFHGHVQPAGHEPQRHKSSFAFHAANDAGAFVSLRVNSA
jgi:hypothetical protein